MNRLVTARDDGWPALRWAVFQRDGGCVAPQERIFGREAATDQCRDQWGYVIPWDDVFKMEFEHVKEKLGTSWKAPDDEAHGVTACPWHHRNSKDWRTDSADHRAVLRDMLRKLYPAVWLE